MGGKLHLILKMHPRLIENKYLEGRMKSTLERELKAHAFAESTSGRFHWVPAVFALAWLAICMCQIMMQEHLQFLQRANLVVVNNHCLRTLGIVLSQIIFTM